LLAGADESLLQKWQLKDAASYAYLNAGKCTAVPSIDDAERFQDVTAAFAVIGVVRGAPDVGVAHSGGNFASRRAQVR
jgi:myosin heavy subunit